MEPLALLALGSNRAAPGLSSPRAVIAAVPGALAAAGLPVIARSRIAKTAPVGPRQRHYANAVVLVACTMAPPDLLNGVKSIERAFGRRDGRRWGPRPLDIDILAIGSLVWPSRHLWRTGRGFAVPHRALQSRRFVLDPLVEIAADWRHPLLGATARQLRARLR